MPAPALLKYTQFLEHGQFKDLIASVDYFKKKPVIEKIFSIGATANRAGLILFSILSVIAALAVFNQVRLAIINSKEEIKVMRLVGATNWFIRGPFVAQGVFAGVFACLIASFVFGVVCYFLGPKIEVLTPGFNVFQHYTSNFFVVLAVQLCAAIGLGVASSAIAMRKYLRA